MLWVAEINDVFECATVKVFVTFLIDIRIRIKNESIIFSKEKTLTQGSGIDTRFGWVMHKLKKFVHNENNVETSKVWILWWLWE